MNSPTLEAPTREPQAITFQPGIYDCVLDELELPKDALILDAGAGEGFFARKLELAGYENVHACDFCADSFLCPQIPFHAADLSGPLPFPDNHFDCVVSIEVIEHLENHFSFVRELIRITKPGGKLIITTPNVMSISSRWHFFLYGYSDCAPLPLDPHAEQWFMQHLNPIDVPMLLFHLERNGAELVELTTNRMRSGSRLMAPVLGPLLRVLLKRKLLRKKYKHHAELFARHARWVLTDANLMGRITIAIAQKKS